MLTLSLQTLDWAAERAGESLESLAQHLLSRKRDRERFLQGHLSIAQATKVAQLARVPFGYLFLETPPELHRASIPDLRQIPDATPLSEDFFDVLADVIGRQTWYIEHIRRLGAEPLEFVGTFKASRPRPQELARILRSTLQLSPQDRRHSPTAEMYFSVLAEKVERLGVLVMKSGIVRSSTRRALSAKEFRGFAIADPFAPVVFVNGRDADVAAVFTLIHELAHIWLGESGVSDIRPLVSRGVEKYCNQVAAELLVPKDEFLAQWATSPEIETIAHYFRVSRLVAAFRAYEFGKITEQQLARILHVKHQKTKSTGGDGLRTIPIRNSKRLTHALVDAAASGTVLIRDAASLLNIRPETVMALSRVVASNDQ